MKVTSCMRDDDGDDDDNDDYDDDESLRESVSVCARER